MNSTAGWSTSAPPADSVEGDFLLPFQLLFCIIALVMYVADYYVSFGLYEHSGEASFRVSIAPLLHSFMVMVYVWMLFLAPSSDTTSPANAASNALTLFTVVVKTWAFIWAASWSFGCSIVFQGTGVITEPIANALLEQALIVVDIAANFPLAVLYMITKRFSGYIRRTANRLL